VRLTVLMFAISFLSMGCSKYVTEKVLPTGCTDTTYYLDADQDGWGSAEGESMCAPKEEHTARNQLDCDDSNPQTTGKVGSVCAEDAVKGANEIATKVFGTREYAAVIGETLSGSAAAAGSCGEYGWGGRWGEDLPGGLATFPNMQGMFRLINEIDTRFSEDDLNRRHFAAWIGVVANADATDWEFERDNSSLSDASAEPFNPSEMGYCGGDSPEMASFGTSPKRLALVRTYDTGDWCFGKPSDANPTEAGAVVSVTYTDLAANFICERPRPDVRCFVADNDTPWLEPCGCRTARGESSDQLKGYYDPSSLINADSELYFSKYDSKLCLDPDQTTDPA
jgi:hypothetical protein